MIVISSSNTGGIRKLYMVEFSPLMHFPDRKTTTLEMLTQSKSKQVDKS